MAWEWRTTEGQLIRTRLLKWVIVILLVFPIVFFPLQAILAGLDYSIEKTDEGYFLVARGGVIVRQVSDVRGICYRVFITFFTFVVPTMIVIGAVALIRENIARWRARQEASQYKPP